MQHNRLKYLFQKTVNGSTTENERQELFVLLTDPDARQLYDDLFDQLPAQIEVQEDMFSDQQAAALLDRINKENRTQSPDVNPIVFRLKPALLWAAACLALLLSLLSYRFFAGQVTDKGKIAQTMPPPVQSSANVMLTLSDGKQLVLDSTGTGHTIEQKGARAVNSGKETLTYTGNADGIGPAEMVFNTLTIPRGRHYKLVLPDGSKVWLNAASSIHYPTHFPEGQRKVELTGEAYFEVAKDASKPFAVIAGGQTISVLGTAFNVKAYTDEPYINTTLVEGSIKLDLQNGKDSRLLRPGEQATLENNLLQVKRIDIKEDISWMSDLFYFSNTDLQVVAHQLQRWYNIEVDFASLPPEKLYGQLPRSTPLPQLLRAMEKTTDLKFKLTNNRLTIEK
ncbi:FecR family protein [Chitinophaga niastensis]|uniref:FecR family protein n=1 Tax=Chitinophaga niastensis TaxID=536980 RepID=A0A2P8HER2_CHINA|nr:FecR domain-containing protein [Chitinophaga niastensis]PSL44708.1 FecR family protein [Chitinophaga niastensis]